jgi:hypothetical protein
VLRTAFSALVGSKYAVVVDGRLMASTLIEDCRRITRHHTDVAFWCALAVRRAMLETCGSAGKGMKEGAPSRMIE